MKNKEEAMLLVRDTLREVVAHEGFGPGWVVEDELVPGWVVEDELERSVPYGGVHVVHEGEPWAGLLVFAHGERRDDERPLRVNRYTEVGVAVDYTFSHLDPASLREAIVELVPWLTPDRPVNFDTDAAARAYFRKLVAVMEGWSVVPWDGRSGLLASFARGTAVIEFHRDHSLKTRGNAGLAVNAVWPVDAYGKRCVPGGVEEHLRIKLNAWKRSVKALAADLGHHLLPRYLPYAAEAVAMRERRNAWYEDEVSAWQDLKAAVGTTGDPDNGRRRLRLAPVEGDDLPYRYGEVELSQGTAHLDLHGVQPATALRIVKLLHARPIGSLRPSPGN